MSDTVKPTGPPLGYWPPAGQQGDPPSALTNVTWTQTMAAALPIGGGHSSDIQKLGQTFQASFLPGIRRSLPAPPSETRVFFDDISQRIGANFLSPPPAEDIEALIAYRQF